MRDSASLIVFAICAGLVGWVLFAQPCEARIIYTPANQVLTNSGTLPIDFNKDGIVDFTLDQAFSYNGCTSAYAAVQPAKGNAVVSGFMRLDGPWASALNLGTYVGNSQPFTRASAVLTDIYGGPGCPFGHDYGYWGDAKAHYLGVEFLKYGKVHFGWAKLTIVISGGPFHKMTTTLSGYAYQTVVGKAIPAGKTCAEGDARRTVEQARSLHEYMGAIRRGAILGTLSLRGHIGRRARP